MKMLSTTRRDGPPLRMFLLAISLFLFIRLQAQEPLTITCPDDITIPCSEDVYDPMVVGDAIISGGCTPGQYSYYYYDDELESGCSYVLQRTYVVSNDCGESATCIQIITVVDDVPLTLDCPEDFFLPNCNSSTMPQQTGGLPSFSDNCSEPEFYYDDLIVGSPEFCCEAYTIIRTWTAMDQCNTPVTCTQFIFVPALDCDDGDPCTTDECINGACVNTPILCDDGDPCTTDACVNGNCVFTPVNCDDGDPCTIDYCDENGVCHNDPVNCDDGDPCTTDACVNGVCVNTPVTCDDGDPCTIDVCVNGECLSTPISCDDGDPCTTDYCDAQGNCHNDLPDCDDGDPCTTDYCENGICINEPIACVSEDPCVNTVCLLGICIDIPVICDDFDPCTIDECVDGICVHTPINCDDGDPGTYDECIAGICIHTPIVCDDHDPCTEDILVAGICLHLPIICDDGDPCTYDFCDSGDCYHEPIACTPSSDCVVSTCVLGICIETPVNCDDGDPCTVDSCDNGDCYNTPVDCDDGDPCTTDACDNGICTHTPINCDDGDPCTVDICEDGLCFHFPINCDDGDPNTEDICDDGECFHELINCDDGDPCTTDEILNGVCVNSPINCDDGDPCTTDACVNGVCTHTNIPGCGAGPPVANCDYSVVAFIDITDPDYNGPGFNNIYLLPASLFDDGSEWDGNAVMEVKRMTSSITFDWTTNGACIDKRKNNTVNDHDKGKSYKPCMPVSPYDLLQWKPYKLRITDQYGTDECSGYYIVIPYFGYGFNGQSLSELLAANNYQPPVEHGMAFEETSVDPVITTEGEFLMFPNPGDHEVYLTWFAGAREEIHVQLLDITGKKIIEQNHWTIPGKNLITIDTRELDSGSYIVQFRSADQFRSTIWVKAEK